MKTIDQWLEETGTAVADLAACSSLTVERVAAIAEGRWTPSPEERQLLAAALGIPVEEIAWGHTMNPRNIRYRRFGLRENF